MAWLQDEYIYRRSLKLTSAVSVVAGNPARITLNTVLYDNGKVRSDLEDLEVVYVDDAGDNQLLYREVSRDAEGIYLSFNLYADLTAAQDLIDRYYVYYGNKNLTNQVTRPTGSVSQWPINTPQDEGKITYTRPGEHWVDGFSSTKLARATFNAYTNRFRINSYTSLEGAIFEVSVDGSDWEDVDLYSSNEGVYPVWNIQDLSSTSAHELKIRVKGEKNPESLSDEVNISSIDYEKPVIVQDRGEEIDGLIWSSSTGGN